MTTPSNKDSRKVIANVGFVNPIEFNQLVEDVTHIHVYADTTELTSGMHYTVSGIQNPSGISITILSTGIALDPDQWIVMHAPPINQNSDLSLGGVFGEAFEAGLDAIIRRMQAMDERLDRSIRVPITTEPGAVVDFPTPVDGAVIGWQGDVLVNKLLASDVIVLPSPGAPGFDIAALKAIPIPSLINVAIVTDAKRYGTFVWRTGDYSAQVAIDTAEAIFIKANAISASLGAWVRMGGWNVIGHAQMSWFNVPSNGAAATAAFTTMLNICAALGIKRIQAEAGGVYALDTCTLPRASFAIDWNRSRIDGTYVPGVGSSNVITAEVHDPFTPIGNLTGGGGNAAAFDGIYNKVASASASRASGANGWVGKTYTGVPIAVGMVRVWGSRDVGFTNGSNPDVTLDVYGKSGAAPANGTDGTKIGTVTFTDTDNEAFYGRPIVPTDSVTEFQHVWVNETNSTGTASFIVSQLRITPAERYDLKMTNYVIRGGWDRVSADATVDTKILAIRGYRKVEMYNFVLERCAKGGVPPTIIFDRSDMAIDIYDCDETILGSHIVRDNRRYETIVIKSTDGTHKAHVRNGIYCDQTASGSPLSFFNLNPGSIWENSAVFDFRGGPNILMDGYIIRGVRIANLPGNGLDCYEALRYSKGGLVENCHISNCNGRGLFVAGSGITVRGCTIYNCQRNINLETALNSNAAAGDYGPWLSTAEQPVSATFENNTVFDPNGGTTLVNYFLLGTPTNMASADITGNEMTDIPSAAVNAILLREARVVLHGRFAQGTESIVKLDAGVGIIDARDADFAPLATADILRVARTTSGQVIPTATIYWSREARTVRALSGGKYAIVCGAVGNVNGGVYLYGPNAPAEAEINNLPANSRVLRNDRLYHAETKVITGTLAGKGGRLSSTLPVPGFRTGVDEVFQAENVGASSVAVRAFDGGTDNQVAVTFVNNLPATTADDIVNPSVNVRIVAGPRGRVV